MRVNWWIVHHHIEKQIMAIKEKIQDLLAQVAGLQATNAEQLEALRIKYLSKKGLVTELFNEFREVPKEEKREIGQALNALRQAYEARINELREAVEASGAKAAAEELDLTRTPDPIALGTRHPLSLVREQIIDIFERVGFTVAEGPEVEDDKHVYSLLNFAPEHPARDMQDTFFIEKEIGVQKPTDILLRSHTSSVQTRVMLSQEPPIRVLCPGRVYRNEAISARAHCFFHQVEGLYIDKNVSFADMKQSLLYFSKELFGEKTQIRMRPSYFPFTEPSAELDVSCNLCGGKGCPVCKGTGWLEIMGCGMVDPNVLKYNNIDPNEFSGFAFGMGIERIAMLKYGVGDLRLYFENDVRFLNQFESAL